MQLYAADAVVTDPLLDNEERLSLNSEVSPMKHPPNGQDLQNIAATDTY